MVRYTVEEAKTHFEELFDQVKAGEPMELVRGQEVVALRLGTATSMGLGCMQGNILFLGNIVAPLDEPWEVLQ